LIPEAPYNLNEVFPETQESTVEQTERERISTKIKMLCDLGSPKNIQTSNV